MFQTHRTVSWADLLKTFLRHEPIMSQENITAYIKTVIAKHSREITAAGNKIIMELSPDPLPIQMNQFLMDVVFSWIIERVTQKSDHSVTFYINLWQKNDSVFLLIGDNRRERTEHWKLISMKKIIEYHNGNLLILEPGKWMKEKAPASSYSPSDYENGIYFAIRLPMDG